MTQYAGASWGSATPEQKAWRRENRFYGVGAYSVGRNWRKFSQSIGLAGAGKRLIGAATDAAVSMIPRFGGSGAYSNSLMHGGAVADEVPQVVSAADETGAITISRREYISDVFAPGTVGALTIPAFENRTYALNPGLEETFPWLSQIAQNYEEYSFDQLIFHFRSTITDIGSSTTGQCGTVIMVTNYNAAAVEFSDKNAMQAYDGAMSCKTTDAMTHGVECDDRKRAGLDDHYVRSAPVPLGQDIKTYDHGKFQMALANLPVAYAGQAIGELWVSYTIKLAKPKFAVARGSAIERDLYVSGNGTETVNLPMGTSAALLRGAQNSLNTTLTLTNNNVLITFPPEYAGSVEVIMSMEGFTSILTTPYAGATTAGNVSFVNDMYAGLPAGDGPTAQIRTWAQGQFAASADNTAMFILHVNVTPSTGGVANTLNIGVSVLQAAPTQSFLDIHEYNAAFSTRALGIGPIGARSDAPILVNAQGIQVVPA